MPKVNGKKYAYTAKGKAAAKKAASSSKKKPAKKSSSMAKALITGC